MKVKVIISSYKDLEPRKTERNGKPIPEEEINLINGAEYFRAKKGDVLTVANERGVLLIKKKFVELVEIEKQKENTEIAENNNIENEEKTENVSTEENNDTIKELEKLNKEELKELLTQNKTEFSSDMKKSELIELAKSINKAGNEEKENTEVETETTENEVEEN